MALTTETDYLTAIKAHKRKLLEQDWHQQSLENGFPIMQTQAVQDVLKQVEDNSDSFYDENDFTTCIADLDTPCNCSRCLKAEQESMAYAMADYKPKVDDGEIECECGGTLDEYDRCSDCDQGHDDCDASECFGCLERAMDRAERMAEGMER